MKRTFTFLICVVSLFSANAQFIFGGGAAKRVNLKYSDLYTKSQLWIGLKSGLNMSWAGVGDKYQIFQPLPSSSLANYEKTYNGVQFPGFQAGLSLVYNFRPFISPMFEPSYSNQSFAYFNNFAWSSTSPTSSVSLQQKNTYSLYYLDFPIYFKMEIYKSKIRPYLLAGIIYSYMTQANRTSVYQSVDNLTGATDILENPAPQLGVNSSFIHSNFWYGLGAGVSYDLKEIRVGLNAIYKGSMNNITSQTNRFANQKITNSGDVLDDIYLKNIEISLCNYSSIVIKIIT